MTQDILEIWGDWMWRRAVAVGFRSKISLAEAVGCSRERIGLWSKLESPPVHLRKGFDGKLCLALGVDRQMLFNLWAQVIPEELPIPSKSDDGKARQEIIAAAWMLTGEKLKLLNSTAKGLISAAA